MATAVDEICAEDLRVLATEEDVVSVPFVDAEVLIESSKQA
jgi:hypothetical protein